MPCGHRRRPLPGRRGDVGPDIELEQGVTGRQRHGIDVGDVPGRDEVAPGVGIALDRLDHLGDLVDLSAVGVGQDRHW